MKNLKYIPLGYRLIAILKLISGSLLVALAFGILRHLNSDWGALAERFVHELHLAPSAHLINQFLAWAAGVSHREMAVIGAGALIYALLYLVEGVGILLGCHWAEYLLVVATGLLLPLEIYELFEKPDLMRATLLLVNALIVAYAVWQLRRSQRRRLTPPAA